MYFASYLTILLAGRPGGSQFDTMVRINIVILIAAFRGTGFDAARPQDVDVRAAPHRSPPPGSS
jgi:hypothetical protein